MTVSSKTFPQIEREMFGSTLEHFAGAYDERDMFGVEEALRMAILLRDADEWPEGEEQTNKLADFLLEGMASIAALALNWKELTPDLRQRLEQARDRPHDRRRLSGGRARLAARAHREADL